MDIERICIMDLKDELKNFLRENPDFVINAKYGVLGGYIHIAVRHGSNKCLKVLLEHGADVNLKNDLGISPLYFSLYSSFINEVPKNFRMLVDYGADMEDDMFICRLETLENENVKKEILGIIEGLNLSRDLKTPDDSF